MVIEVQNQAGRAHKKCDVKDCSWRPSEFFGAAARPASLPLRVVLLWNQVLVQSFNPEKYHRYCFDDPAVPLALASAVRFFLFGLPPTTIKLPAASSLRASPSFRVLPSNTYPTASAIRSSHGLWLPTAHGRIRGPLLASSEPLATFRLQGLVTLLTACSLESRAGFVSHRRRSWDSPFGGFTSREKSKPFGPKEPTCCWPAGDPEPKLQTVRQTSASGFTPPGSALWPREGLTRQPPAPPLGFAPLGPACEDLDPGSPPRLLSRA